MPMSPTHILALISLIVAVASLVPPIREYPLLALAVLLLGVALLIA